MEMKYEIKKTVELTKEEVKDILTCIIEEGATSYYACLRNDFDDWAEAKKLAREELNDTPCYCDTAYKLFELEKPICFSDTELEDDDPDFEIWEFTKEKFLEGCRLYEETRGKSIKKAMEEGDFDAEDGDALFQLGMFGEIVYG